MHNGEGASDGASHADAGRRLRLLVVRCSDAEREAIRRRAAERGVTVSRLLRDSALGRADEERA